MGDPKAFPLLFFYQRNESHLVIQLAKPRGKIPAKNKIMVQNKWMCNAHDHVGQIFQALSQRFGRTIPVVPSRFFHRRILGGIEGAGAIQCLPLADRDTFFIHTRHVLLSQAVPQSQHSLRPGQRRASPKELSAPRMIRATLANISASFSDSRTVSSISSGVIRVHSTQIRTFSSVAPAEQPFQMLCRTGPQSCSAGRSPHPSAGSPFWPFQSPQRRWLPVPAVPPGTSWSCRVRL